MPNITREIKSNSKLHQKLTKMIGSRIKFAEKTCDDRTEKWRAAEEQTMAYMVEQPEDAVRRTQRKNEGKPKYTTIQIPYTYAMLMTIHTYVTSVFFGRTPVHQFAGRHGEAEQQVQAVEALISYQTEVGEMMGPYYLWCYDALKYGLGIIGEYWDDEIIHYGQIVESPQPDGSTQYLQAVQEIKGYSGNRIYNISPYNWFHDPRVTVQNFQKGEFVFCWRRLGWSEIVRRQKAGYFMNIDEIKEHKSRWNSNSGTGAGSSSDDEGSSQLKRPTTEDFQVWEADDAEHPSTVELYEFYVELIPSEWGVGDTDFPQKWVFTLTADLGLIVGAQPLGYYHGKFPFSILEAEVEGYGIYSRGIPEIISGVQQTIDWLLNTHFYNVRAALNNQFVLDPSKLIVEDVQGGGPGFRYRLRPEAYGTDLRTMFMQVPVNDVTRTHTQDVGTMLQFGERILGANDQMMGMLTGGGRKTATEVRASSSFGVNRQKTITEYMSHVGVSPHARRLVQSSQQYYDGSMKMRIVGDLAAAAGPGFLQVTPELIAGNYSLIPVDGTLPVDRMAQANLWKELLVNLRNYPQIMMSYDVSKIFAWVASLAGLKNINQFKVQPQILMPGQQPAQGAVPMGLPRPNGSGVQPGNSQSTAAGLNSLLSTQT